MKTALFFLITGLLVLDCYAGWGLELHKGRPTLSRLQDSSGFRLPKTAKPNYYVLSLTFGLGGDNPYAAGLVSINLDVDQKNDKNILYLNSNVTFAPDAVAQWETSKGIIFECSITPRNQSYIVLNCTGDIRGKNQTVTMKYTPYLSVDDLNGAYVSRFNEDGAQKYVVATQFEQISARRVFPSFDEPEFKAPIRLTLITNDATGYGSHWIANTKEKNTDNINGMVFTSFEPTPAMSTYLLAFIITQDFHITTSTAKLDYSFSVFARKSADNFVSCAMKYGPEIINKMGDTIGITYFDLGNSKITLAALPEFTAGAMENWGLITFRENFLLDEGANTPERDIQGIVGVMAHELTHQWFGDYVTMTWWSDTWLNEGFAQFFEYYLVDQVLKDYEMWKQLIIKEQQAALKVDAYPDSIPLSSNASDVTTQADFSKEFGTISYSKGASIIKMIKYAIGDKAFFSGLTAYLKKYQYKDTKSADLITALQNGTSLNLIELFDSWIFKNGYPIVNVTLDNKTNTVTFKAGKFSSSINKSDENTDNIWYIPLSYTTSEKVNFSVSSLKWIKNLTTESVKIPKDGWIIVNLQSAGFYRVNYDETLWDRLILVLSNSYETIDVVNRAQLLDDVFNIARSIEGSEENQKQNYLRAFKLANYLKNETEYHPWYTFFVEIQYLLDRIQDDETLNVLKKTVKDIVSLQADIAIKATKKTNLKHMEVLKNNLLLTWSCKVGYEQCIQWAQKQFDDYKNHSSNINNNYRDVILCTGLANSANASSDYKFLLDKLDQSNLPGEQNDLAKALTCVKDKNLISQLFQETLKNHSFPRMLYPTILAGLISNGTDKLIITLKSALENDLRVNEKWQAIGSIESILATIAAKSYSRVTTMTIIKDYLIVYMNDTSRASIVKAAMEATEVIETNAKWVDKYDDILTSVIVYDGGDITTTSPATKSTTPPTGAAGTISQNVFLLTALVVSSLRVFYC
ncbi:aminopeptidase N-like [Euwallacea fornicatus]|uniref:aminopeptidase N-like n=1 Tax=Euwallacea fornicatus TaxID=995702 RepID=UPI00338DBD60